MNNYMEKQTGYCEDCIVHIKCPWFCNIEKDECNNPLEACYDKEFGKNKIVEHLE